jgi:hypothetical protein
MYVRMGVMAAYGPKAVQLLPGTPATPPSRRPRGALPGQTQIDIPGLTGVERLTHRQLTAHRPPRG